MSNLKLIGHAWFTGQTTVGIVLAFNEISQQFKAYISSVKGENAAVDVHHILSFGCKFPVEEAISLVQKVGQVDISNEELAEYLLKYKPINP